MDGPVGRVVTPVAGVGSLVGSLAAWAADEPIWASVLLVVGLIAVALPVLLVVRLARRLGTDALARGTSLDVSYHALKVHVGRNTTPPRPSPAPEPEDRS